MKEFNLSLLDVIMIITTVTFVAVVIFYVFYNLKHKKNEIQLKYLNNSKYLSVFVIVDSVCDLYLREFISAKYFKLSSTYQNQDSKELDSLLTTMFKDSTYDIYSNYLSKLTKKYLLTYVSYDFIILYIFNYLKNNVSNVE